VTVTAEQRNRGKVAGQEDQDRFGGSDGPIMQKQSEKKDAAKVDNGKCGQTVARNEKGSRTSTKRRN
jgi:hypothetical protein